MTAFAFLKINRSSRQSQQAHIYGIQANAHINTKTRIEVQQGAVMMMQCVFVRAYRNGSRLCAANMEVLELFLLRMSDFGWLVCIELGGKAMAMTLKMTCQTST